MTVKKGWGRARKKIQQEERKKNVKRREIWGKDGKIVRYRDRRTRLPIHKKKEQLKDPQTYFLSLKLNYTVHGQLLAGAIDFKVLSPIMPLNHFESS